MDPNRKESSEEEYRATREVNPRVDVDGNGRL